MSDTKSKIIDAAIDLFAQNGYTETNMRSIAKMVGIQPPSIYNHFKSKQEILETIFDEYQKYILEKTVTASVLEQLEPRQALEKMFFAFDPDIADRMTKIFKILLHEQFHESTAGEFVRKNMFQGNYDYIKSVLDRLVELHKIREIRTEMYAKLFMAVLMTGSNEIMHFAPDEQHYMGWWPDENVITFLIDQILAEI